MKKAVLLYNPKSGNRQIVNNLDYIIEEVQKMDYQMTIYRSEYQGAIKDYITNNLTMDNTNLILISGGDGTLNDCINGMIEADLDIPIGVLPLGTANDFAYTAQIPNQIEAALNVIKKGAPKYIDIGQVNDKYFINVCNMGLFSGVSHHVDLEIKKKFGKLAYYVKSIEEFQNYKAMELQINVDGTHLEGEYLLVLVFNGQAAGGFTRLAKNADIQDGLFDVICIKNIDLYEVPKLFMKVLQGEHLNNPHIDYLTGKKIKIECTNMEHNFITDVDGEIGPDLPLDIQLTQRKIQVYLPESK